MSQPSRIKQLDERTIGHIAAGEVVERPAQVVKELIENSIDADSSRITIDIERGGFDLIRITDDGSGIHEHDLSLSLDRHATSKLSSEEDLAAIGTLGFRGEALAAISSVSMIEMSSSKLNENDGYFIELNGGKIISEKELIGNKGTSIKVQNLFYNVPARRNFLKSDFVELKHIINVFNRLEAS